MRLIGISGMAGSGKDAVASILCDVPRFAKVSLSDPMKEFCQEIFGFDENTLWGPSELRNAIDPRLGFSAREALQKLGTQYGRDLYPDVWINVAIERARVELDAPVEWLHPEGVVIPDVRFPNEAARIRAEGGEVWRIIRPGLPRLEGEAGAHISEHSLTDSDIYDRIIVNNTSLGELEEIVLAAIQERAA